MDPRARLDAGTALALSGGEDGALWNASSSLDFPERLHLLLRFRSAPWARVVEALEPAGSLVDFGCGPGLLAWLLSRAGFGGVYVGLDPDARKVNRAGRWLPGSAARRFVAGDVASANAREFSQAALLDVLYLVPRTERVDFVRRLSLSIAPGGLLVVLTSGGGPGWKRSLDAAQERLAVGLGITRGGAVEPCDGAEVARILRDAGFGTAETRDVGAGFLHGFEIVTARLPGP